MKSSFKIHSVSLSKYFLIYALFCSEAVEGKLHKHNQEKLRHRYKDDSAEYKSKNEAPHEDNVQQGRLFGFFEGNGSTVGDYLYSGASQILSAAEAVHSAVKVVTDPLAYVAGTVLSPITSAVQVVTNPIHSAIGSVTEPVKSFVQGRIAEYTMDQMTAYKKKKRMSEYTVQADEFIQPDKIITEVVK